MFSLSTIVFQYFSNFKFSDTHVEGAKVIAEACRNAGVSRLVHVSALGARKDSPSRFLQSKVKTVSVVKTLKLFLHLYRLKENYLLKMLFLKQPLFVQLQPMEMKIVTLITMLV